MFEVIRQSYTKRLKEARIEKCKLVFEIETKNFFFHSEFQALGKQQLMH